MKNELLNKIMEELTNGKLRDKFEELFPKDQEAIDGERPSKSGRSKALLYYAFIYSYLKSLEDK